MARQRRFILPGEPHLVHQRGHNGTAIVHDAYDERAWLAALRDVAATRRIVVHAFSLEAEAFRLMLTPPDEQAIGRLLQDLGRRCVVHFNARHARSGALWDGRYRCAALQRGTHELQGLLWVEGDVEAARASSLGHHLGQYVDASLGDPPAYWALGNTPFERQAAWQARLALGLAPAQLRDIERALSSGIPLATAQRLAELQPLTPLRLFPRPRGRPRRSTS